MNHFPALEDIPVGKKTTGELVAYCLSSRADYEKAVYLGRLSVEHWEAVLQQSIRYGVAPLLYKRLKALSLGLAIPSDIVQRFQKEYFRNAIINTRVYHGLSKILKSFKENGIPVIVLKGAYLAQVVYGNIALRSMCDVDLMVRRTDLTRVDEKLLALGYSPQEHNRILSEEIYNFSYRDPSTGLYVEIHWSILPSGHSLKVDIDGWWRRSRPERIANAEAFVLSPEDLLLFLCLHLSKDTFQSGLRPFCDILETIRYYEQEIDWKIFGLRAREWCTDRPIYLSLRLAKELLDAPVPDGLLKGLKPNGFDESFLALAKGQIFPTERHLPLNSNIAKLWGKNGNFEKVALFLRRILPSRTEMSRTYPPPPDSMRIFFYYPVRIKELFLRYRRQTWSLLHREDKMVAMSKRKNAMDSFKKWLLSP